MFGFSSYNCYTCLYLDKDHMDRYQAWCNYYNKWIKLEGPACRNYESAYLYTLALLNNGGTSKDLYIIYKFINKYVKNNETGKKFLEEYNSVGPVLCECINNDKYKIDILKDIKENYADKMIEFISTERLDDAQETFIDMYNTYKDRYGFNVVKNNDKKKTLTRF